MWIVLNNAYLSAVESKPGSDILVVRARIKGDLEAVFPKKKVTETPNRDYRYRTFMSKQEFAEALAREALSIDYTNFKDSVKDKTRAGHYSKIWGIMFQWQNAVHAVKESVTRYVPTSYFHRGRNEGAKRSAGYYESIFGPEAYEGYEDRRHPTLSELDGDE